MRPHPNRETSQKSPILLGAPRLFGLSSKLRIVVGHDGGTIDVTATGGNGIPSVSTAVMILPASAQNENELAARMRSGSTNGSGIYSAASIPPGRYYILATDDPPLNETLLPTETTMMIKTQDNLSLLLRARSKGQAVDVGPGATVHVRVTPKALE